MFSLSVGALLLYPHGCSWGALLPLLSALGRFCVLLGFIFPHQKRTHLRSPTARGSAFSRKGSPTFIRDPVLWICKLPLINDKLSVQTRLTIRMRIVGDYRVATIVAINTATLLVRLQRVQIFVLLRRVEMSMNAWRPAQPLQTAPSDVRPA